MTVPASNAVVIFMMASRVCRAITMPGCRMHQPRFPRRRAELAQVFAYCRLATRQQRGVFRSASIGGEAVVSDSELGFGSVNKPAVSRSGSGTVTAQMITLVGAETGATAVGPLSDAMAFPPALPTPSTRPNSLQLRLSLPQGGHAVRARHRTVDGHRPKPAQTVGAAAVS